MGMESSSEDEDDFPTHEWITPQSHINSLYQSQTEKGIRQICSELLDLKDAVENLRGNMHSKYSYFLRISEEVVEMEQELIELQKHVSAQGILVQDLMSGVCHELDEWNKTGDESDCEEDLKAFDIDNFLNNELDDSKLLFLQTVEVLLAEHKIDEAVLAFEKEEALHSNLKDSESTQWTDDSSFEVAFREKKAVLVDQLVEMSQQPSAGINDIKKVMNSLLKLGKSSLAHQLLLKAYDSRLRAKMEVILPSCSTYSETYAATLSQLVFSTILAATKNSHSVLGDSPSCTNRIIQWAEDEMEFFVQQVKDNAPQLETALAIRSASNCLQASLTHCSSLSSLGLEFSKVLKVRLIPYFEEILDLNFKRAKRQVLDISGNDDGVILSPELCLPLSAAATSNLILTNNGKRFMSIVMDILEKLTPMAILHFGGTILNHLYILFEEYVKRLVKAIPAFSSPSEDDGIMEHSEGTDFLVETDAQQLALLGTAYTVAEELLPVAVSRIINPRLEPKEPGHDFNSETSDQLAISMTKFKEWKRQLQHSVVKLKDHFCRQYILTFIYSREDKTRLDARMYLYGGEDNWDSNPLPSLPFQALFARLQQLASVASDVLGKEKLQKSLLSRLTETVVIWLSAEQDFWDVFEDESVQLKPSGLQQLILDMHFIVEITVLGGYPSRIVHQTVSTIITQAVGAFSKRGIDPQSTLRHEDEWFVDAAKTSINKLLLGTSSGFESSEIDIDDDDDDADHINFHDDISYSADTPSSPLSMHSMDSFVSATMDEIYSTVDFTDSEP